MPLNITVHINMMQSPCLIKNQVQCLTPPGAKIYAHMQIVFDSSVPFKTQCVIFVTLTFHLSMSTCFGELTMTPYVPRTLTYTNAGNWPIFKFGSQIKVFVNIDIGIALKL